MTELHATLSADSLGALEARLRRYADDIDRARLTVADTLAETAAEVARATCPVDTGELVGSIRATSEGNGYAEVTASTDHAAFVEFGTGIGAPSGHAGDAKAMGASGYAVNASGKGEPGWFYPADDGTWKLTHGQSGKGFMAAGAEEARSRVAEVARRALRQ